MFLAPCFNYTDFFCPLFRPIKIYVILLLCKMIWSFVMKIRFLLIGASLSLIPTLTSAQCVATQDCATLGYTETSCSGGTGVKCPFGNKWACFKSESEFCNEYGFTQTCTGTNQTGGTGKACNGKYNYCSCADGYVWQNGACTQSTPDYSNCVIGALYYADGTCSNDYISSKKLLGIVIYEKSASQNGWVMTHKPNNFIRIKINRYPSQLH